MDGHGGSRKRHLCEEVNKESFKVLHSWVIFLLSPSQFFLSNICYYPFSMQAWYSSERKIVCILDTEVLSTLLLHKSLALGFLSRVNRNKSLPIKSRMGYPLETKGK